MGISGNFMRVSSAIYYVSHRAVRVTSNRERIGHLAFPVHPADPSQSLILIRYGWPPDSRG